MKVYKLEIMVIDEDVSTIENAEGLFNIRFANHANVSVITCKEAEIGEWDDNNPLNDMDTQKSEMNRLFPVFNSDYAKCIRCNENNRSRLCEKCIDEIRPFA